LELPGSKSERGVLKNYIKNATDRKPIRFYVGSCPDYSHEGGKYTHKFLGSGVPLLTQCHLEVEERFFSVLRDLGIPFEYVIMVADVEATDGVFCQRFTGGNEQEFLARCRLSVEKTQELLLALAKKYQFSYGSLRSSSFFEEFGKEEFLFYQASYQELLARRFREDGSFRTRVIGDLIRRRELYQKMYPNIFGPEVPPQEKEEFLVGRTLRTMAQYLTLGRLIAQRNDCHPAIICHLTTNLGMFNDRNKFRLKEDGAQPQPTIPVFKMERTVY